MNLDSIILAWKNFYYTNNYLALAIVAGLVLFVYFNIKAALKTIGILLIILLAIYSFSLLGHSASTGLNSKKQMSTQTTDRFE